MPHQNETSLNTTERRKRFRQISHVKNWLQTLSPKGIGVAAPIVLALNEWASGDAPLFALMSRIANALEVAGLIDPAREASRKALAECPSQPDLIAQRARLEFKAGNDAVAVKYAEECLSMDSTNLEALFVLEELSDYASLVPAISAILLKHQEWGKVHDRWTEKLSKHPESTAIVTFLQAWINTNGSKRKPAVHLGTALLGDRQFEKASQMLVNLWKTNRDMDCYIGEYRKINPEDREAEDKILSKIISALSREEDFNGRVILSEFNGRPPDRVLYLGQELHGPGLQNDIGCHLCRAAAMAGCTLMFDSDPSLFDMPRLRISDTERTSRINDLLGRIRNIRPQVIVLDCCWNSLPGDLRPRQLRSLKEEIGCRVLCLIRDAQSLSVDYVRYWSEAADGLIILDPLSPVFHQNNSDLSRLSKVFPVPVTVTPPVDPVRGLLFIGSLFQPHRSMLIASLLEASHDISVIVGPERLRQAKTQDEYRDLIASSLAALNVAVHAPAEMLITGRCWETIAAGSVLLEQEGSGLNRFFIPYRHYIPWNNPNEIAAACRVLKRDPALRRSIINSAQRWADTHYSPRRVWLAMMAHAFNT